MKSYSRSTNETSYAPRRDLSEAGEDDDKKGRRTTSVGRFNLEFNLEQGIFYSPMKSYSTAANQSSY